MRLENLSDLEFELSVSLKVKANSAVGSPIYDFLFVSNTVEPVLKDHTISHKMWSVKTGGLW